MIAQSAKFIKQLLQGDALPAYVLFREPAVVISYFEDFVKHRDAILAALSANGIPIPFSQRLVHYAPPPGVAPQE